MDEQVNVKLQTFFHQFPKQQYKKNEILIHAEDKPAGIFYLEEGMVKQYTISKKGEELVVNMFKPVSFFPMSWGVNDTPNHYYFEAVDEVLVYKASREEVVEMLKREPTIVYDLLQRMYRGLDGMLLRMTYLMAGNASTKLLTELLIQAKRFGQLQGQQVVLTISEKDLAAQAGMARETVSREMKLLRERGLLSSEKKHIIIHNLDLLEEQLR